MIRTSPGARDDGRREGTAIRMPFVMEGYADRERWSMTLHAPEYPFRRTHVRPPGDGVSPSEPRFVTLHPPEYSARRPYVRRVRDGNHSMDPDISLPTASPIAAQPIARSRSWRCRRHTGTSPGEFHNPYGIAVDGNGFIYVSDNMNNRIQRLNPDGSAGEIWNTQTFD
ncbi:MAG: hypothetical protein ACKOWF_05540, partial [Chloroflexota bacterium]